MDAVMRPRRMVRSSVTRYSDKAMARMDLQKKKKRQTKGTGLYDWSEG